MAFLMRKAELKDQDHTQVHHAAPQEVNERQRKLTAATEQSLPYDAPLNVYDAVDPAALVSDTVVVLPPHDTHLHNQWKQSVYCLRFGIGCNDHARRSALLSCPCTVCTHQGLAICAAASRGFTVIDDAVSENTAVPGTAHWQLNSPRQACDAQTGHNSLLRTAAACRSGYHPQLPQRQIQKQHHLAHCLLQCTQIARCPPFHAVYKVLRAVP